MHGRILLSLTALFVASSCSLTPGVEQDTAALECSSSALSVGGCVTGFADRANHGYHRALLRRGDRVKVTLERVGTRSSLNPGLALKSPQYSIAVRHDSVSVREDRVEKIFTIKTTGFHTFVAFAWSNEGRGNYKMSMDCVGGPCSEGLANTLDADLAGACLGEARDCVLRTVDVSPEIAGDEFPAMFRACMRGREMPAVCANTCTGATAALCDSSAQRLAPFGSVSKECIAEVNDCLTDCVSLHTPADAVTDINAHPQAMCWGSTTRPTCAGFGASLDACGAPQGLRSGTPEWCSAACIARESSQSPTAEATRLLTEDCDARCEYVRPLRPSQYCAPGATICGTYLLDPSDCPDEGTTPGQTCADPDFESPDPATAE